MSCAYQYGVETTAQPAAIAKVSAPEAICSRLAVRRHEHVGRREQVGELVDREEAVVELDVVVEPELEHPPLEHEAVPLALAMRDVGMRSPGDHVDDLGMALDDRTAAPRSPSPGPCRARSARTSRAGSASPSRVAAYGRRASRDARAVEPRRRAVRHDANLLLRAGAALDEQPLRGLGHHDHELGLARRAR